MKHILYLVLLLFVSSFTINAQKIEAKKVLGGYVFEKEGEKLNLKQLQEVVKENKQAFDLVKSAKSNETWAAILGGIGGGLIGFPLGTAIAGGDAEWALAGVGAALIIGTIPIVKGYNKKTKQAVDLYNADVVSLKYNFQPTFDVNIKGLGMGISMRF